MAKISTLVTQQQTVAAVCDRCQAHIEAGTAVLENVTQIQHRCGYGGQWEDGALVLADICEKCLQQLIGTFCRVQSPGAENHAACDYEESRDLAISERSLRSMIDNPDSIGSVAHWDPIPGNCRGKIHPDWNVFFDADTDVTQDIMADRESPMASKTEAIAARLLSAIEHAFAAHIHHPNTPADSIRFWDRETPYAVHPTWCAMTLLCEPTLDREIRLQGAVALQWHDLLEDTQLPLPAGTPIEIVELVEQMTFASFAEEQTAVWSKSPTIRLLKLVDKTSNLLDCHWMKREKRQNYARFTQALADDAEQHFGTLNVVRIARALIAPILDE